MDDKFLEQIPKWLKSLWDMEIELRKSARSGIVLQKDDAANHLAEARRHLEEAMKGVRTPVDKG